MRMNLQFFGGRGASSSSGNRNNVVSFANNSLQALQNKAKGTPAEEWYNESGQSYEQLRSMENIYDLPAKPGVRVTNKGLEDDPTFSRIRDTIDSSPVGTTVSYQLDPRTTRIMRKTQGGWESNDMHTIGNTSVMKGGTLKKYNGSAAQVSAFNNLQSSALRKTLTGSQVATYKRYYNVQ